MPAITPADVFEDVADVFNSATHFLHGLWADTVFSSSISQPDDPQEARHYRRFMALSVENQFYDQYASFIGSLTSLREEARYAVKRLTSISKQANQIGHSHLRIARTAFDNFAKELRTFHTMRLNSMTAAHADEAGMLEQQMVDILDEVIGAYNSFARRSRCQPSDFLTPANNLYHSLPNVLPNIKVRDASIDESTLLPDGSPQINPSDT